MLFYLDFMTLYYNILLIIEFYIIITSFFIAKMYFVNCELLITPEMHCYVVPRISILNSKRLSRAIFFEN